MTLPTRRLRSCVEAWPDAETGAYDPRCCRFPKSCSAAIYDEGRVTDEDLEPSAPGRVTTNPTASVQATQRAMLDEIADLLDVGAYDDLVAEVKRRLVSEAAPGPTALFLPQFPPGTVALVAVADEVRYELDPNGSFYRAGRRDPYSLIDVLAEVGPQGAIVELAPPREPRTELPCGHLVADNRFESVDGRWMLVLVSPDIPGFAANTTPLVWCAEGHGWVNLTADEYTELNEVVS